MIPARINIITLGVSDLQRAGDFYKRLGWRAVGKVFEAHIRFFALDNVVLALFPVDALAKDATLPAEAQGFIPVTTAINLATEPEVDAAFSAFLDAGARAVKPPQKAEWGGYSGYVADPDGHLWEVAHNPFSPLDAQGMLRISE